MTQAPPTTQGPIVKPHRGAVVLTLGIVGLVFTGACGFIVGIIAWVMGNADLKEMDRGTMDPTGRGLTQAGRICGIISTILGIALFALGLLWLVLMLVIGVGGAAAAAAGAGGP
jgi:hypothetical protein